MKRGFTLIELLVVVAIIGILIALLIPAIQAIRRTNRASEKPTTTEAIGTIESLTFYAAEQEWRGKISGNAFRIAAADADCIDLAAKLRLARLKDQRVQGIIRYQGSVDVRGSAFAPGHYGRLVSVDGVDSEGGTVALDVTDRDRERVREMMR